MMRMPLSAMWVIGALLVAASPTARGQEPPAKGIWRTFEFRVTTREDEPVVGAMVRPWQVAYGRGSTGLGKELEKPLKTDNEGKFQLVVPMDAPFIRTVESYGIRSFAFNIDHPDHPVWSDYVAANGVPQIRLPDSATITVHVLPAEGTDTPRDLYPVPATSDWSEKDGVVTIRRVDLQSKANSPWLRIVQAPEKGPESFTDLIYLRDYTGPNVSIEAKLQPGVRVAGRLAENATRPIKNGRTLATINSGGRANGHPWYWRAATDIDEEGNFVFESLPADDTLQLIALCDGWVSVSPTSREVAEYGEANNFATQPLDDRQMQASNRVYPRLFRLAPPEIEVTLPMEATLSCMITVLDHNDLPLPGAKVSFWPNQYSFDGGSQILGQEGDSLAAMRASKKRKGDDDFKFAWPKNTRFTKTTDDAGIAIIHGLPFALSSGDTLTREYEFHVSHDKFGLMDAPEFSVKIEPGKMGKATVRMAPK